MGRRGEYAGAAPTDNDTFRGWREGDDDDLVLAVAVAVACWYATRGTPSLS
jgi:hypothetical protein